MNAYTVKVVTEDMNVRLVDVTAASKDQAFEEAKLKITNWKDLELTATSDPTVEMPPTEQEISQASKIANSHAQRAQGLKNMAIGAAWCIGGIIVTVVSYSAVAETGGTYLITWGAVIFGGFQFFKGLFQYLTA